MYGVGVGRTECLQEPKGRRRDSVCEAADPDLQIGIATFRRFPLVGNSQELPRGIGIEPQGENHVDKIP